MGIIDRFRIENAVQTYDFWLELRGMRSRRRKGGTTRTAHQPA